MSFCPQRLGIVVGATATFLLSPILTAQNPDAALAPPAQLQALEAEKGPRKGKKDDLKNADEVTKGMEVKEGFYRLYHKKGKLFIEIPRSVIGKPFFFATSFAGGNTFHGWQWSDQLLIWERFDKKLLLVEKDVRYKSGKKRDPLEEVVRRTYSDRIVLDLPIKGQGSGAQRGYLIDGNALLAGNARTFFGGMAGNLKAALAKFDKIKVFKDNCEIAVTMPTQTTGQLTTLHYSLARFKKSDYKPRVADDRIGYFLTAIKDFSSGSVDDDLFLRYINRWHLKKRDPSLELSPPEHAIVFYIEKTVPIRYRRFVREGIQEWNHAFEKVGFYNAIDVRQQTETDFADLDPEDSNYNFFRWITSGVPFAMGPSRVNPRTGEILDADIIFDDSMANSYLMDYDLTIRDIPNVLFSPRLRAHFQENPSDHPYHGIASLALPEGAAELRNPLRRLLEFPIGPPSQQRAFCTYGEGLAHQLCFAAVAKTILAGGKAGPEDAPDAFIGAVVKETVMHEVGHTLGLRHNFKASTWKSLEEIKESEVGAATVGSVMDYNPVNIVFDREQRQYITGTLGPYDYWAIDYGYSPTAKDEDLAKIASRVADEGLAYGTDEDLWQGDPTINQFDLATDPLDWASHRLELVHLLLPGILDRVVDEGEGYHQTRRAFDMLLSDIARAVWLAARHVGGVYVHRDHKGDPNGRPPIEVVSSEKQAKALELICSRVLAPGAMPIPRDLLNYLTASRWSHWGTFDRFSDVNYPILERILGIQSLALTMLLNPETLGRVRNGELRVAKGEDALTIPVILDQLTHSIFRDLQPVSQGLEVAAERQNLQRRYVGRLIDLTLRSSWGPDIAQSLARQQLRGIAKQIQDVEPATTEPYTRAHFEDLRQRISKALDAGYITR